MMTDDADASVSKELNEVMSVISTAGLASSSWLATALVVVAIFFLFAISLEKKQILQFFTFANVHNNNNRKK